MKVLFRARGLRVRRLGRRPPPGVAGRSGQHDGARSKRRCPTRSSSSPPTSARASAFRRSTTVRSSARRSTHALEYDRKAVVGDRRRRRARDRMRRARQRRAGGVGAWRDHLVPRVLRLRSQVHRQRIAARSFRRRSTGRSKAMCGGSRSRRSRRSTGRDSRASIFCSADPPASSSSTRSTRCPASRRSACTRSCGPHRTSTAPSLVDRLITLALERHTDKQHARPSAV